MPRNSTDPLDALLEAIGWAESRGRYDAVGPRVASGMYAGQRALGRYQVMPGNLPEWSRAALGREVTPDEFLASPELQDQIARHRLGTIYGRYGNVEDVASVWHSGRPLERATADGATDGLTSTQDYVQLVTQSLASQQPPANPDLQRLERALRAAHAAGDVQAAQRFAAEIRRLQTASPQPAAPQPTAPVQAAPPAPQPAAPTPRELGRQSAEQAGPIAGRLAAFGQGGGSMFLGVGTPLTAAEAFVRTRLNRDPDDNLSWGDAMEFARGRREGLEEQHRGASRAGKVAAFAGMALRQPLVPNVFRLQSGQTLRNAGRLAATGAAGAGVTAGAEQGLEAVPSAAAFGAVAAPALGAGLPAAARGIYTRWNNPFRHLARIVGESAEVLEDRFNRFRDAMGRAPRLAEIVSRDASEELGRVGRVRSAAARVFRDAQEEASQALPREVARQIRRGGTTTVPAQEALLAPQDATRVLIGTGTTQQQAQQQLQRTAEQTRATVASRSQQTGTEAMRQAVRSAEFDAVMDQIGHHQVPISQNMMDVLTSAQAQRSIDPVVRGMLNDVIDQAQTTGATPAISLRMWDTLRQEVAKRAGPGVGRIYADLREQIRDYASRAVPEYGDALRRYGDHGDFIEGLGYGSAVLSSRTRDFVDTLRTVGGTVLPQQASSRRAAVQEGAAHGARQTIIDALSDTPQKAERFMKRLATSRGLRRRVEEVLTPDEVYELKQLGELYGHQLRFSEGVRAGSRLVQRGDREALAEALRQNISPTSSAGLRAGVRGELAAGLRTEESARRLMERLATDDAYREGVLGALTQSERDGLEQLATRYGQRLRMIEGVRLGEQVMTPGATEPFTEAAARVRSTPEGAEGLAQGARRVLADVAEESPEAAQRVAMQIVESPGFRDRLAVALGADADRIQQLADVSATAAQRMDALVPSGNMVDRTAMEQSQSLQQWFRAAVIFIGRYSGALAANFGNQLVQRLRMTDKAARRLAELAVDPQRADEAIQMLRRAGLTGDEILQLYQNATLGIGATIGQE